MEDEESPRERADSIARVGLMFSHSTRSRMSVDHSNDEVVKKKRYTREQWVTLITLAFGNFCIGAMVSLQAPFFPQEAESKGATPTEYGLIFGVYELVVFVTAPIMGKMVSFVSPKFVMNSGIFAVGATCICFGCLDFLSDRTTFVGLAFAIRILEGVGAAAGQTATFVIIAAAFPDNVGTSFALLETFIGIGLIIGPTLGGALFDVGGFGLPFYVMGSLMIINALVILFTLPDTIRQDENAQGNWISFWMNPITVVYVLVIFSSFNYIGFNSATLEPHLREFELSGVYLGLIFALGGTLYAVTAPLWGWLTDQKIDAKLLCILGCFIALASLLLIGPMPFLHIERTLGIIIVGLTLQGIALGAKLVCAFTGSLGDTIARGFPTDITTYGLISSMFASSQSLGAFIGPSLGGYLFESVGYDYSVFVVFCFEAVVTLFLTAYAIASRCRKNSGTEKMPDDEKKPILSEGNSHSSYSK